MNSMAGNSSKEPKLNDDAQVWYDTRAGYRAQLSVAFQTAALEPSEAATGESNDTCVPAVGAKRCVAANDAFIPLPDASPEYQEGVPAEGEQPAQAWPMSPTLYAALALAFTEQKAVSAIIPLQLQLNTLESYRRMLLHKKWRRCHHLVAMAENLRPEVQAEKELQELLLGQQIGQQTPE